MYTIKQAARLAGVPESSLRAWERRYGVVVPTRNSAGYRLYDDASLAVLSTMRRLIDEGWSAAAAAEAMRAATVPVDRVRGPSQALPPRSDLGDANACRQRFLTAAAQMDAAGLEEALDLGFGLGSFEHVMDSWLFPVLAAIGTGWQNGEIDVAGEHLASHAVHRRLSAAFQAAGSRERGPTVVVGLPPGGQHEFGALAFATAIRRRGLNVLYLGADVPVSSWTAAVERHTARAAVVTAVTPGDRRALADVIRALEEVPVTTICIGGVTGRMKPQGTHTLPSSIAEAARELDELLWG